MLRPRKSWTTVAGTSSRTLRRSDAGQSIQVEAVTQPAEQSIATSSLCIRMARHWYRDGSAPDQFRPKCPTEADIQAFEEQNGVRFPADFREYFQRLNGIDMDPGLFRFWPLSRLIPLKSSSTVALETDRHFVFADYMVGTWYYAIYLGEDPFLQNRVILPDFPSQPVVAHSFSEFVELYLADSPRLYGNQ